jgi:hypothetical protein
MRVISGRQYYYTSYVHQQTGRAGFQVKAMSPDLTPELQETIARLIAYRVPPALDIQDIETHPVSLRYAYKGPDECILLCSQSCGRDEYGRPGNFFAHAVVLEQDLFTSIPPVFFWKSAFWCRHDPIERTQIASLPMLPALDEEPALDLEDVWAFVAEEQRRTLLYKLLCGVVQSHRKQWRIVICDSDEHVALWVAAVSCLLPPAYRPLLTFATYHHDPHQSPFLITGADAARGVTVEDDASIFLLDAANGRTSAVEPSPYAELAVAAAQPDLYESLLLSLFTSTDADPDDAQYYPFPLWIDEQLDQLALYARYGMSTDPAWLQSFSF